jgi:CelD/BcsL family acetyltransferase involved in cellulose biosynthesis
MKLYHIRTIEEFKKYKSSWDRILEVNQNTNPFIEFEWILNWWIYIGKEKIIEIIAVENNDEFIGFFPFQFTYKWKSTVLEFMGRNEANYGCDCLRQRQKTTIAYVLDELIATNQINI